MRAALIAVVGLACGCSPGPVPDDEPAGRISVAEVMGDASSAGFARALGPREIVFPEDHGPHEGFRTEWWYLTGNLADAGGDAYGFQLTIFRHALASERPERGSRWASRDVWFAHLALGDAARGRFAAFERFERGAVGLAGARATPFAAWVGGWRVASLDAERTFPLRLTASEDDTAIDLVVDTEKPLVLQGERGLSRKGPEPGNASYYYSATRLAVRGSVTAAGVSREVTGQAWLDHEWSTSALSAGQTGWDWFAIQLDDGRELMLYRLRHEDGSTDPWNRGTLVEPDGTTRTLGPDEVRYRPGRVWNSPRSGVAYPVEWSLSIAPLGMELDVEPLLETSELDVSVRYWEGAIRVRGRDASGPVAGRGFLEMTGYETGPASAARGIPPEG